MGGLFKTDKIFVLTVKKKTPQNQTKKNQQKNPHFKVPSILALKNRIKKKKY